MKIEKNIIYIKKIVINNLLEGLWYTVGMRKILVLFLVIFRIIYLYSTGSV